MTVTSDQKTCYDGYVHIRVVALICKFDDCSSAHQETHQRVNRVCLSYIKHDGPPQPICDEYVSKQPKGTRDKSDM